MTRRAIDCKEFRAQADLIGCEALRICGAYPFAYRQKSAGSQHNEACVNEVHGDRGLSSLEAVIFLSKRCRRKYTLS